MKIEKYAAIDIGSNAIRVLISNVFKFKNNPPLFVKNEIIRVPIRLGEDSFTIGEISKINIKKIIKALRAFRLLMEIYEVKDYMICATSALRESTNSKDIVELVKDNLDLNIQVIDGRKEAQIISNINVFNFNDSTNSKNFLYVDVGGGSTEFSILIDGKRFISKSFKIGTVRSINNMVNYKDWIEIEKWVRLNSKGFDDISILGSGGNINKVFKIAKIKDGNPLTLFRLNSIYKSLSKLSYEERIYQYSLNPDRADVIIPAIEIYLKALYWSGSNKIYVPKIGLSDGMIVELYNKNNR